MKTTKEIADTVFRRRDAYFAQQRARNRTIRQAAVIGTSVCGCGILAFSGLHFRKVREPIPSITPAETTAIQQTSSTLSTTSAQTTQTTVQTVRHTEITQAVTQTTTALTESTSAVQTTALTTTMQTKPATTAQTEHITTSGTTETITTTETIPSQTEAAGIVNPTPATAEPKPVTTEPVTETTAAPETRQLDGFRVEQYADCQKIICTDEFPAPDGELASYVVLSDAFTVLSMSEPETPEPERSYEIECAEAGKVFTVTQREYSEFVLTVEEGELINISIVGVHGFFLLQDETCSLYWFRDGEGFYVQCDVDDLEYLMEIARSFTPAGEQK